MFSYTEDEVYECFASAGNLNAAIKHMMRSDTSRDPRITKFAKAFRQAIKSPKLIQLKPFLEKALPNYEEHLYLLLRHAYAEKIDPLLDEIINEYAEEFNGTYDHDGSGAISVTDEKNFEALGRKAVEKISNDLQSCDAPNSGFMKNAVAYSLFDQAVLVELTSRIENEFA